MPVVLDREIRVRVLPSRSEVLRVPRLLRLFLSLLSQVWKQLFDSRLRLVRVELGGGRERLRAAQVSVDLGLSTLFSLMVLD